MLLTVILLDVCGFEILWVEDVVEDATEGRKAIGSVRKVRSASCVNDVSCIQPGVAYFFEVMTAVVTVRLRPWGLDCWWLSTPGTMTACDFLVFLVSLVLLFLLMKMASRDTTCLRYNYCSGPRSGAMKRG